MPIFLRSKRSLVRIKSGAPDFKRLRRARLKAYPANPPQIIIERARPSGRECLRLPGVDPYPEDGWGGCLGRCQTALLRAAEEIEERNNRDRGHIRKQPDRSPDRGR